MPSATVGTLRTVLEADVSQFNASFAQASRTTKQWAKDFDLAGKSAKEVGTAFTQSLERSLSNTIRLAKEFSGAGIAKTADEMAAAVERIGGPLRLTATEQARVNSTVTEAIAKYKALGADAPAHLLKLADATKQVAATTASSLGGLSDIWGKVQQGAGLLGIGLGASAVVKFATDTVASASAVHDLAEKLGVSTTKVQQWSYALVQTGGSQDNLNISLAFLNKTLGEGNKGTNDLLASMGLSLKTLREQKPEQTFEQLVEKIGAMTDPLQQAKAAVMLFGKSGQDMLPAIKEGFLDIARAAPVMSEAAINALERAGDEWDKFLARIKAQAGTFLGTIAAAQNRAADVMRIVNADTARARAGGGVSGRSFQDISAYSDSRLAAELAVLDALEKADKKYADAHRATGAAVAETTKQFEYATAAQLKGAKPMESYVGELTDAKKAVHDLTAENKAELDAGILMGKSQTELSQKVGISEEAVKLYTEAHQKAVEAAKAHKEALDNLSASAAQLPKQVQEHILQLVAQGKSEHDIALVLGVHEQQVKDIVSIYHDWQQATKDQTTAQDGLDKALQHLNDTNARQARADMTAFWKSQQDQADASAHNMTVGLKSIFDLEKDTTARIVKGTSAEYDAKKKLILDWGKQQKEAFQGAGKDAAAFGDAVDKNVIAQIDDLGKASVGAFGKAIMGFGDTLARAFEGGGGLSGAVKSLGAQIGQALAQEIGTQLAKNMGGSPGAQAAGSAIASTGVGYFVGTAISNISKNSDLAKVRKDLEAQITAMGATPVNKTGAPVNGNWDPFNPVASLQKQLADLQAAAAQIQKQKDQVASLSTDRAAQELSNMAALGFPDTAALQKTADALRATYDTAVKSGKYSTDQLAVAWKHVEDATNAALGVTKDSFKDLISLGQQYGFTLEDMGKGVQFGNIDDQVSVLLGDYKKLLGAGTESPFAHFESKFQDIFLQAQKLGVAIPEALRPYLQQMVNLGDLVDQTGAKVKTLNDVNFGVGTSDAAKAAEDAKNKALIEWTNNTDGLTYAADDANEALNGKNGMTQALIEATRTAEAFTAALPPGGWMGRGGGAGTIALADVPLMSVTAPGVVRVTPGDWVGKPGMTPGFGNFNMDRPISLTIPVHVGGRLVDNYVVETTLRKLEQNDSGGANLSYRTRLNRVIG